MASIYAAYTLFIQESTDPAVLATVLVPQLSIVMNLQAELQEMIMADQEIVMTVVDFPLQSTLIDMFQARTLQVLL
jgi:hypothetical protein